jgi:hypothetical protein
VNSALQSTNILGIRILRDFRIGARKEKWHVDLFYAAAFRASEVEASTPLDSELRNEGLFINQIQTLSNYQSTATYLNGGCAALL